jgi:cytochrome c peroxidase
LHFIAFLFITRVMPFKLKLLSFLIILMIAGCVEDTKKQLPETALEDLGQRLFFDTRLSFNNTKSCASCHDPKFAFSDSYRRSITATGDRTLHNAPSLVNVSEYSYFDWANPSVTGLLKQSDRPMFSLTPIELGITGHEEEILQRIRRDSVYAVLFPKSFPGKNPFTIYVLKLALEAYVESIRSAASPYDRFIRGDSLALSTDAKKGMSLFLSNTLKCASCHPPPSFTTNAVSENIDSVYFNTGLYNINNKGLYPSEDNGIRQVTGRAEDDGKFKIPSLRNVELTGPYTHDGSVNSLGEMIDIYQRGGRLINNGPWEGDGKLNPHKHKNIAGFPLSADEKRQLILFLDSLTDSTVLVNPKFQNPFH